MVKSLIIFLPFLLVSFIPTVNCHPTTLSRRLLLANCDPIFGGCRDQWPYSPITYRNSNPYISRPFLRHPLPSPLVASPPPPMINDFPPVLPELPPPTDDTDPDGAPPFDAFSFSPPEVILPPPVVTNPPDLPAPDFLDVPAPPLVPIVSDQPLEDPTQLPQDLPFTFTMPPPDDEYAKTKPQLPPMVLSPPDA